MIVALDPGDMQSAIVMFDGKRVHFARIMPNAKLLALLRNSPQLATQRKVFELIGHYGKGMPAGRSVFDTCIWSGQFQEACEHHGGERVQYVLRATVKTHLCGTPKAKDANVSAALRDKYSKEMLKEAGIVKDLWAAMAVADWALSNPV